MDTGERIRSFSGHKGPVYAVAMSADGRFIASSSWDNDLWLWDSETGEPLHILKGHTGYVISIAFSPDGAYVVSGSHDTSIRVWRVSNGQLVRTLEGHLGAVEHLVVTNDSQKIISASRDGMIFVFDMPTEQRLWTLAGNKGGVNAIALSLDNRFLVGSFMDGSVWLWDLTTGESLHHFASGNAWVNAMAFSMDNAFLVGGLTDGRVQIWDTGLSNSRRIKLTNEYVKHVQFSPNGEYLAIGLDSGHLALYQARTLKRLWTVPTEGLILEDFKFSQDGQTLTTLNEYAETWSVLSGERRADVLLPSGSDLTFSPDSRFFLSTDHESDEILFSEISSLAPIRRFTGHGSLIIEMAISPNNQYVASAEYDGTVFLWNVDVGQPIMTIPTVSRVYDLAFSPDSQRLAIVDNEGVSVWDTTTHQQVYRQTHITPSLSRVTFSPDSQWLLGGTVEGNLYLWRANTAELIRQIDAHKDAIDGVVFSPDGAHFVSIAGEEVRLWETDFQMTIAMACNRLLRDLTADEKQRFGITASDTCTE